MPTHRPTRSAGGFTLFEVMAAVLVLGIFYTVLAGVAIDGLRSEGTARRRAEASMLADRRLAELETSVTLGSAPAPGLRQEEAPPYRVAIEVTPIDVRDLLPPDPRPDLAQEASEPEAESLLALDASGQSRVRELSVTVEWDEAGEPYRVTRRSFAFDTAGLEEIFPSEESGLGGAPGGGGEGGGEGEGEALPEGFESLPPDMQRLIEGLRSGS